MASSVQHSAHTVDKALNTADLRVLVACLYHLTGDEKWLSDEMRPQRDVRLVADPMAGFSQETADFIKNAARDWLLSDTSEPAITDPGPDTFGKMMSFFLGEEVPPEYVPMIRKDFGYSPRSCPEENHLHNQPATAHCDYRCRRIRAMPRSPIRHRWARLASLRKER